ncbi:MAG: tRNA pseudouridine(55) synthase TruB [Alphaproteobacteria bacterium]|nr:tRNA pseudouridine(55) synthase TruB [Alphaproteobacteria bacterium]
MKRTKHKDINGWLIIDKPQNMGSTDVVNHTRRLFDANKNGHAGTLDPFATGVLPIAFGEATKLIPFVTDGAKEYEFVLKFGAETNTDDIEGQIINTSNKIPSKEEILNVLPNFLGTIQQTPPAYSAIKINGQRAYKLAREGKEVNIPTRNVTIDYLDFLEQLNESEFKFRVGCSKGTYIRTLGKDIALKLGSLGYLTALRRTKCAIFSLQDTILLENLKNMVYEDERLMSLLPIETSLRDIAVIAVSEEDAVKLKHGQGLSPKKYQNFLPDTLLAAMYNNCLIALVRVEERKLSPIRVFNLENKKEK